MTTQETVASISAVIAAISVITNAILGVILYRLKKRDDQEAYRLRKRDEEEADRRKQREGELANLIGYVRSLFIELERTNLFDIRPEDEIWEFGFFTLSKLAELCAFAYVAVAVSSFADQNLRAAVSRFLQHVKGLREFQDSWRIFCKDKKIGDWRALQREWPDIQSATAALQAARLVVEQCKDALSQFLAKQEPST